MKTKPVKSYHRLVRPRFVVCTVSLGLFIAACLFPALELSGDRSATGVRMGYELLALGWMGVVEGQVAWFANPMLAVAMVTLSLRKRRLAVVFGVLGVLLALDTFTLLEEGLPVNELGARATVLRLALGFYLWMGSLLVVACSAVGLWLHGKVLEKTAWAPTRLLSVQGGSRHWKAP